MVNHNRGRTQRNRHSSVYRQCKDNFFEVKDILVSSGFAIGAEGKVLETDHGYEILSSGYSNETSWHFLRDVADEVRRKNRIDDTAG